MGKIIILSLLLGLLLCGCINQKNTAMPTQTPTETPNPETWKMRLRWNISTSGIPFMDMSPDGSISAAVDWNKGILYLIKPDGESTFFNTKGKDEVRPVIAGLAVKDVVYVLASYQEFAGVRKYSWSGFVGEEKHGWAGSVADNMARSPSGNHLCYLVTINPTEQEMYCDGNKLTLSPDRYSINSVSDSGVVVLSIDDRSIILEEGKKLFGLNTSKVLVYKDRILASENGKLKIYSSNGELLLQKEGYTFDQTTLLRWTLIPTEKYLFRYEPLENTHVLTWNLTEVRELPGFPYFANDNFVVTGENGVLHCYSLKDFHEVWSVKRNDVGYVRLSDDGRVLLVSGETGGFSLYTAETLS